jgi:SAM-dependent methyltransferase
MPDFSHRSTQSELMDSDETDFETFRACLVDLGTVNTLTLAHGPTLRFLAGLSGRGRLPRDRPVTIVDVGSGYGDMLRLIAGWAARRRIDVDLTGIDLNPWSTRAAQDATGSGIRFVTSDLFDYRPAQPVDIVISSLFAHHLDDAALLRFVAWMERTARIGWFVNDLHRHPLPYHAFRWASWALRFHYFVQHDGPVSIARAFTAADWRRTLAAAGVPAGRAEIKWRFPFRLCVSRVQTA